jgi:hypothetical protein
MTRDYYAQLKANRDRYDVITGQIKEAETLLDQLRTAPKQTTFEVRPEGAPQGVGGASKEVLCAALRQYIALKEEVLTGIEFEFSKL